MPCVSRCISGQSGAKLSVSHRSPSLSFMHVTAKHFSTLVARSSSLCAYRRLEASIIRNLSLFGSSRLVNMPVPASAMPAGAHGPSTFDKRNSTIPPSSCLMTLLTLSSQDGCHDGRQYVSFPLIFSHSATHHPDRCRSHHRFHLRRNKHHQIRPWPQWNVENARPVHGWFRRHFWVRFLSIATFQHTLRQYSDSSCPSVQQSAQKAIRPLPTRLSPTPTASLSSCPDNMPLVHKTMQLHLSPWLPRIHACCFWAA